VTSRGLSESSAHLLRELAPQVLGAVVRRFRDFAAAEDAVQEALVAATLQWPQDGVPENPRGWLIQVASRRLTDHVRSESAPPTPGNRRSHGERPTGANGRRWE
jgi:predicted RNA polymerase sigma factor